MGAVYRSSYDVAVIGAGAAGLFCAGMLGQRGKRVLLVESGDRPGRKILISGGGRCNFTNLHCGPGNFVSENPHFAKSALARYVPGEFVELVERHRIAYHHKALGQLFCDGPAKQIVDMLLAECARGTVETVSQCPVSDVQADGEAFRVMTAQGDVSAGAVVVASGGLSIPKMGVSGTGYEIARRFGMRIVPPRPALVPLVLREEDRLRWCDLSGVAVEVVAEVEDAGGGGKRRGSKVAFREKLLVTHRGLSGPAVLQVSSYWRPGMRARFDLAPGREVFTAMQLASDGRGRGEAVRLLREVLPSRMAERWVENADPVSWTNSGIEELESQLHGWSVLPAGDEGYAKAEVTAGGVSTADLDSGSMQAKGVPGLAFIGEVVDVTGHLGGHNFQWAWASGAAVAVALS